MKAVDKEGCRQVSWFVRARIPHRNSVDEAYWFQVAHLLLRVSDSGNSTRAPAGMGANEAADLLAKSFNFSATPPSPDFWDEVVAKLRRIGSNEASAA